MYIKILEVGRPFVVSAWSQMILAAWYSLLCVVPLAMNHGFETVLVSYGWCNKVQQIQWLKTTQVYYLVLKCIIGLEVRSPTWVTTGLIPRGGQGCVFSGDSKGESISLPFQLLGFLSSLAPGFLLASNHITMTSASVVTSPSPTLILLLPGFTYKNP